MITMIILQIVKIPALISESTIFLIYNCSNTLSSSLFLCVCYLTSYSRVFHSHGAVTVADEVLQNLDLCSAPEPF